MRPERLSRLYLSRRRAVAEGTAELRQHDAEAGRADAETGAAPAHHPPMKPSGVGRDSRGRLAQPAGDAAQGTLQIALGGRREIGGADTADELREGGEGGPPDPAEVLLIVGDDVGDGHDHAGKFRS